MKLRNCVRCGRLMAAVPGGQPLCTECRKQEQAEFEAVRDYLKQHPNAPLVEVSQATGVSVQQIMGYIRAGRLAIGEPGAAGITCERCGKPIVTGRLCDRCTRSLVQQLRGRAEVAKGQEPRPTKAPSSPVVQPGRVHLADRLRRERD